MLALLPSGRLKSCSGLGWKRRLRRVRRLRRPVDLGRGYHLPFGKGQNIHQNQASGRDDIEEGEPGRKAGFLQMNQKGTMTMASITKMMSGTIATATATIRLTASGSGWLCNRSATRCIQNTPGLRWKLEETVRPDEEMCNRNLEVGVRAEMGGAGAKLRRIDQLDQTGRNPIIEADESEAVLWRARR